MQVKWLTRHLRPVFHHECLHPRAGTQETRQRGAGQDDMCRALRRGQIAHELERIPQSLLGVDEQGLVRQWRAIPAWLWKRWGRAVWRRQRHSYSRQPC